MLLPLLLAQKKPRKLTLAKPLLQLLPPLRLPHRRPLMPLNLLLPLLLLQNPLLLPLLPPLPLKPQTSQ